MDRFSYLQMIHGWIQIYGLMNESFVAMDGWMDARSDGWMDG